jgi:hypothetical protein
MADDVEREEDHAELAEEMLDLVAGGGVLLADGILIGDG